MAAALPNVLPASPSSAAVERAPRQGAFREVGTVRHSSIHAARYRLLGTAKVLGDVDVDDGIFEGILSVGRGVLAQRVRSRGTLEVGGDVSVVESFLSRGSLRVGGSVACGNAELRGISRIAKDLRVTGQLDAHGALEVGGALSSLLFTPDGRFTVGTALRAREVVGSFDGESRAGLIEASSVTLRPKAWIRLPLDLPPLRPKGSLTVERIEAESVDLEGVSVHFLKAPTISLGRHCHVAQVEGRVVRRDRSSYVGFESRSPPPPGLSR